jgi:hypothetical protein
MPELPDVEVFTRAFEANLQDSNTTRFLWNFILRFFENSVKSILPKKYHTFEYPPYFGCYTEKMI